eukprot:g24879.t1
MTPDGIDLTDQEYLTRFGTVVVFVFLNEIEAADLCFPSLGIQVTPCSACAVVWSTSSTSEVIGIRCVILRDSTLLWNLVSQDTRTRRQRWRTADVRW